LRIGTFRKAEAKQQENEDGAIRLKTFHGAIIRCPKVGWECKRKRGLAINKTEDTFEISEGKCQEFT
jgi:hypothetical protein